MRFLNNMQGGPLQPNHLGIIIITPESPPLRDPAPFPQDDFHRGNGTDRVPVTQANLIPTRGNSGNEVRSIPSSGSGHGFVSDNLEASAIRPNKKSINSWSGLEPVEEEISCHHPYPNFNFARLSEITRVAPENADEIRKQPPEDHANQQSEEGRENIQVQQGQTAGHRPFQRRVQLDTVNSVITNAEFKSWLENSSDIMRKISS